MGFEIWDMKYIKYCNMKSQFERGKENLYIWNTWDINYEVWNFEVLKYEIWSIEIWDPGLKRGKSNSYLCEYGI